MSNGKALISSSRNKTCNLIGHLMMAQEDNKMGMENVVQMERKCAFQPFGKGKAEYFQMSSVCSEKFVWSLRTIYILTD